MKKTWITKAMITLMTLALVAGVFIIAPKGARADISGATITPIGSTTAVVGGATVSLQGGYAGTPNGTPTYTWASLDNSIATVAPAADPADGSKATVTGVKGGSVEIQLIVQDGATVVNTTQTVQVNQAPSFTTTTLADAEVGKEYSQTITASGTPTPDISITVPTGYGLTATGNTISGTPTQANTTGITVTAVATNSAGTATKNDYSIKIAEGTQTLSNLTATPNGGVAGSTTVTLSATNNRSDGGAITWAIKGGSALTGNTYASKAGDTAVTFTATAAAVSGKYAASAAAEITVNFTLPSPGLTASASPTTINASGTNNKTTLSAAVSTGVTGGTYNWTKPSNAAGTLSATSGSPVTYTADSSDIGKTLVFTVEFSGASEYKTESKTVSVTVQNTDIIISPDSNVRTTLTNINDKYTAYLATSGGTQVAVRNSNPNAVEVYYDGVLVTSNWIVGASGKALSARLLRTGGEWAYIDVAPYGGTSANTRRISIYTGGGTPKITAQFWSCDDCATDVNLLNRSYPWGTLKVRVSNYNQSYPYVTIHRSNVRTYVKPGSYSSHANNLDYTLQLSPDPNNPFDGIAYAYIEAQYNGTTNYTVAHHGATTVTTSTIRVSGYPALPQTGPDYTLAYVLGGLCLITAATAVTLNVRKKKQKKQEI